MSIIHNVKDGFQNIIRWFPVIWQDRQWSGGYGVMTILHKKLSLMEDFLNSKEVCSVQSKKHLKKLRIAKNLAKRLSMESYINNATLFNDDKFMNLPPLQIWGEEPIIPTPEQIANEEWFRQKCDHSDYMEKQDREMFYNIMKKMLSYWWD
jgi:hypothetical protein